MGEPRLSLGNGNLGACILGGITKDRLQLNEKSLWSGGPAPNRTYQGGNLPERWASGVVRGLVARGNYEISMEWENGIVRQATLLARNGGKVIVKLPDGKSIPMETVAGREYIVV